MLSAGTLGLGGKANPDQSEVGLELLHGLGGVVDEGEAGGLAATELGSETEDVDLILLGLVHGAELLSELLLGDVGTSGVEDVTVQHSISPIFFNLQTVPIQSPSPHFHPSKDEIVSAHTSTAMRLRMHRRGSGGRGTEVNGCGGDRVRHSHDHLLASQQRVADELASSEGDGGVVVRHGFDG